MALTAVRGSLEFVSIDARKVLGYYWWLLRCDCGVTMVAHDHDKLPNCPQCTGTAKPA
jgi:hypothetical protein